MGHGFGHGGLGDGVESHPAATFLPFLIEDAKASVRCHEIASPSRSRVGCEDQFVICLQRFGDRLDVFAAVGLQPPQVMAKLSSGLTEPSLGGRSRTWP